MGDLAKYIAEVIEFVVAGILVLFSLLLLTYVVVDPDLAGRGPDVALGALGPVLGLAVVYALGIMAEGVSRVAFEWHLDKETRVAIDRDPETGKLDRKPVATADYRGLREAWRMRVMGRSVPLAVQIESQLKRLRIERASALAGVIAVVALGINLVTASLPGGVASRSWGFVFALVVAATAVALSFVRHGRYVGMILRCKNELP